MTGARRSHTTSSDAPRGRLCTFAGWRLATLVALFCLPGRAAAQVDPSGRWRTLHTPHFRVHFRPVDREPAERTAREAERAWGLLATELRPPRGTVDVTLSDDIDISNGFTTVFPSTRITVLAAPLPELTDFDDWLRLVTTHELTHVFHLDRTKGWWRGLQSVFGRVPGLFPNEYQPSWVIEGLAVYYESRFTEGGRLHGGFHTQLIAAAAAVGRPAPPPAIPGGRSTGPCGPSPCPASRPAVPASPTRTTTARARPSCGSWTSTVGGCCVATV